MSDYFDRLDGELATLTRRGAHLAVGDRALRRASRLLRRGVSFALVTVALATALVSEFPASASGHAQAPATVTAQWL